MRAKRAKAPPPPVDTRKVVLLAAVLDLKAVAPLADELLSLRGSDVQVDASAVQRLGAQCLQVLLAARQLWQADRAAFLVSNPSEPMRSSVALLGATSILFDPTEICP